jgi:hypothetical protein
MERHFGSDNENAKHPDNPNNNEGEDFKQNLNNEQEYSQDLEKSFLTDLNSQIELESQIIEDASKTNNHEKLRESLLEVRKFGEELLKNISATTVRMFNSNKLVVKLRDSYIGTRGLKIYKELSVSNSLARPEDYDSFIKMLESDFWGKSKNTADAVFHADRALEAIAKRFPGKSNDALDAWPELFNRNVENISFRGFNAHVDDLRTDFNQLPGMKEKAEFIKDSNDLVALKCLSSYSLDDENIYVKDETIRRVDSIIDKYPKLERLPQDMAQRLLRFAGEYPDQILGDSRRVDFIFKLWKSELKNNFDKSLSSFIVPIIAGRLQVCSSEEIKEIIGLLPHAARISNDFNWLLNITPLDKSHLKLLNAASENKIIELNKDRAANKETPADRLSTLLFEESEKLGKGEEMVFISNLIVNYPDGKKGINEAELATMLDSLISTNSTRFNLNNLHSLAELMNRHSWPNSLRGRIFSANDLSARSLNEIMSGSEQKYAWIEAEPLLAEQLQLSFHQRAAKNDLRHYFYNVLDGTKKSNNLDDLIKSYGQSEENFDFEEIKSLFIDGKIDKKYIPYFINKVSVNDIIAGLDGNTISDLDQVWMLESIVKHGQPNSTIRAFRRLNAMGELNDQQKKMALIDSFADNVLLKCDIAKNVKPGEREPLQANNEEIRQTANEIFDPKLEEILGKDETSLLGKKVLTGALDFASHNRAGILVLNDNPEKIKNIFPDNNERKDYLIKIFSKVMGDLSSESTRHLITRTYFSNPELFEVLNENERLDLENKVLAYSLPGYGYILLDWLNKMDSRQQEAFITLFEKTNFKDSQENSVLCYRLVDKGNFSKYPAIFKRAYLHMLQSPGLNSDSASTLFKKDIILNDNDLRSTFFANLVRWPEINGTTVLESMAESKEQGGYALSLEEVKQISATVMQNRGLSPEFWAGYQKSDKNNPTFYLDKEIFRLGLENVGNDCLSDPGNEIVTFLKSLSESEFELSNEDARSILKKALNRNINAERIKAFHEYDADFMENFLSNSLSDSHTKVLDADLNYSAAFNNKLLDYILLEKFSQSTVDAIFARIKKYDDSSLLTKSKEHLSKMSAEQKMLGRLSLLKYDFLSVEESKSFYKEITTSSTDNVRTQILNSIDVISSMLSNRNNIDSVEKFLDKPRPQDIANLKEISGFIEKYSKENKGRSIAVMLFAREYLPDRPLEEVIEKVAYNLRKSEEIIEQNSYKNVPAGIRASIGMEYEITSSTANGYQELTSQASLKTDIARLSQAARIGSGKDAVHEIATRPTDNPYLMLLEMKLLHDIEYIDLNFDRSENYQKGARGFHLTIGGEKGLIVDRETNLLQNALIAASWGGVQSGEIGHKVNGGRGVSLRNREGATTNNVAFFGEATNSVELRSLSIDKQETLQRAVTTAFNGAIAIQAFQKCFPAGSAKAMELLETGEGQETLQRSLRINGEETAAVANLWINLVKEINEATKRHNESFLDNEMLGYLDKDGVWVDASDFGGQYNKERFQSIVKNIDPTLSLEEYVKTTEIGADDFFKSLNLELSDKLIKINNLYLKPGVVASDNGEKKTNVFKGDQANSLSMLTVTKMDNDTLENYDDYFLKNMVFDTAGEKRKGYYALQGGSELMLTHSVQKSLLSFNEQMEKMLN